MSNGYSVLEDLRALSENRYGFLDVLYYPQSMGGYRFRWNGPYTAVVKVPSLYYVNHKLPWKLTMVGSSVNGEDSFVVRTDGIYALSAVWHWLQSLRHRTLSYSEFRRSLPNRGPGLVWPKLDETEWKDAINIGSNPFATAISWRALQPFCLKEAP